MDTPIEVSAVDSSAAATLIPSAAPAAGGPHGGGDTEMADAAAPADGGRQNLDGGRDAQDGDGEEEEGMLPEAAPDAAEAVSSASGGAAAAPADAGADATAESGEVPCVACPSALALFFACTLRDWRHIFLRVFGEPQTYLPALDDAQERERHVDIRGVATLGWQ